MVARLDGRIWLPHYFIYVMHTYRTASIFRMFAYMPICHRFASTLGMSSPIVCFAYIITFVYGCIECMAILDNKVIECVLHYCPSNFGGEILFKGGRMYHPEILHKQGKINIREFNI